MNMNYATQNYIRPGFEIRPDPDFPNAPIEWSRENAEEMARREGMALTEEHWQVVCALQEFYARHDEASINIRNCMMRSMNISIPKAASNIFINYSRRAPWPRAAGSRACKRRAGPRTRVSAALSKRQQPETGITLIAVPCRPGHGFQPEPGSVSRITARKASP
jgi:sulfur relay (sulfurtransferase) DsrC/TusE family protein